MAEDTELSSANLREIANGLAESRAGREVARVPEAAPTAPAPENGADPHDQGMSLKVAAQRRAARVQREAQERASYEAAAQLSERPLPANLDASDSEVAQQEIRQLHETMAEVKYNQANAFAQMQQDQAAHQAIAQTNHNYESTRQKANAVSDYVVGVTQQEVDGLRSVYGDMSDADIQQLYALDPGFREAFDAARGRIAAAEQQQAAAIQDYANNFGQLASLHDAEFQRTNPDMADADLRAAAAKGVVQMLKESGYDDQTIHAGWNYGVGPLSAIRDNRQQSALLELWRGRVAKQHLQEAKEAGRPVPPRTQRPGSPASSDVSESTLRNLTRNLEDKGSVKAAAALLSARRMYQRGSR